MAISLVTSVKATPGANGGASGSIDTSGSSLLVLGVTWYKVNSITVSDSKSNTWTPLTKKDSDDNPSVQLYYVTNPTVGSGHTFTVSGTSIYPTILVLAFSGAKTTSPFDVENGAKASSVTTLQPGSITPSENNEVVVTAITNNAFGITSINGGYTIQQNAAYSGGNNFSGAIAYLVQTSAAATNPTWTIESNYCSAVIASFKEAVGGGGTANPWFYYAQAG